MQYYLKVDLDLNLVLVGSYEYARSTGRVLVEIFLKKHLQLYCVRVQVRTVPVRYWSTLNITNPTSY